jgi:hypothetical protein
MKYKFHQQIIRMSHMHRDLYIVWNYFLFAKYKPKYFHLHTFKFQLNVRPSICLLSKSLSIGSMTATKYSYYAWGHKLFPKLYDYRKCL